MVLVPLLKVLNEDNGTGSKEGKDEEVIKFRKDNSLKKSESSIH